MDKFDEAIELFKMGSRMSLRYQERPIVVTYSGGKDSDVILEVAKASGEPFEVHNNHTTVDAPQTVYHIRKKFKELEQQGIKCIIEKPTFRGGARHHVEFDTRKENASNKASKILLLNIQRKRMCRPSHRNRSSMGRKHPESDPERNRNRHIEEIHLRRLQPKRGNLRTIILFRGRKRNHATE